MPETRTDRDLLIRMETKLESVVDNFSGMAADIKAMDHKVDARFNDFDKRLIEAVKDIKEELDAKYVNKQSHEQVVDQLKQLKEDLKANYTPVVRFEPVEEVYRDVSKRIRTMLVSVGVCILIAGASLTVWLSVGRGVQQVQAITQGVSK